MVSVRDENGGGAGAEKRPFGTVVASAVNGFRALAREHVDLLKLDVSEAASVRGQGVGMMGAAVVVAMYAVGFLAAAGAAALALVVPIWAAILIVAVLLGVVAGLLILIGRRTLRTAPPPAARTQATLKEDAQWAKQQIAR
jgi:Putative Actinobacterial Holin-X, holin superfamily III